MSDNKAIVGEWISIEDRLPELPQRYYDEEVGLWATPITGIAIVYDGKYVYQESFDEKGFGNPNITHWMPLPNPPLK